jgi:transmembrane sensor
MDDHDIASSARRSTNALRSLHLIDWAWQARQVEAVLTVMNGKIRRRRRRNFGFGVIAAMAVIGAGVYWGGRVAPRMVPPSQMGAQIAAVPERRVLADGTMVDLKPGSAIEVAFSATVRRVRLVHGVAHFQVAKDKTKPFLVEAGDVQVRAVGTAFSVDLQSAAIEVLVTEGRVAVNDADISALTGHAPPPAVKAGGAVVDAGNRVVVSRSPDLPEKKLVLMPVSALEIEREMAWRVPNLELSSTELADALKQINAYSPRRLVVEEPSLGKVRLSGVLRADNVDTLLVWLKEEYGIEAVAGDGETILLRKSR